MLKKALALFLSITLLLSFSGCKTGSSASKAKSATEDDLVTVYLYTEYSECATDGSKYYTEECEYDESGNLIHYTNGHVDREWEYDDNGNEVLQISHEDGTRYQYEYKYEYDKNDNLTLIVCYSDGEEKYREEYEYDRSGNLVQIIRYLTDQSEYREEYEYDSNGNMTQRICFGDGEEGVRYVYEYDNDGNMTQEICFYDGEEGTRDVYEYDKKGKLLLKVHYIDGQEDYRFDYSYTADKCIATQTYSDGFYCIWHYKALRLSKKAATNLIPFHHTENEIFFG